MLGNEGFRCERPPEGWLYKVYDDNGSLIDLIFAPNNRPEAVDEILSRADELEVFAITMKVMSATDVLASKLLAMKEHVVDYESVPRDRARVREQIDWDVLRHRTGDHPFAKAFFTLARGARPRRDERGLGGFHARRSRAARQGAAARPLPPAARARV